MEKSNMTILIAYGIKKIQFGQIIWSEVNLRLPLYINRSVAKKFPTERFLKTVDSSVRNPREVEYDKWNRLQRQKPKLEKVWS